jgi:hypothetical protein
MQTRAILWEFKMRLPRKAKPKVKELGSGIDDLPIAVALVVEENLAQSRATEPTSASASPATTAELVERLTAIRERIWRLRAVFAVTLSHDAAVEADRYVEMFQSIGRELQAKDAGEYAALTRGHEALLESPPVTVRPTIPLAVQHLAEMRWEAATQARLRAPKRPTVSDGLDWMVG